MVGSSGIAKGKEAKESNGGPSSTISTTNNNIIHRRVMLPERHANVSLSFELMDV